MRNPFRKKPKNPPTAQEIERFRAITIDAFKRSARQATLLIPTDPPGADEWQGSYLGDIRVAGPDDQWPVEDGLPMLPLLQLRIADLPQPPESLASMLYLCVWCAQSLTPRYPGELQHEFLEIAMSGTEADVERFRKRHESVLTIEHDTEPDSILVRAITPGAPVRRVQSPEMARCLKPARIEFRQATDYIGQADCAEDDFMTPEDRAFVRDLRSRSTEWFRWYDGVEKLAPNLEETKVGGWPSPFQGQPTFGLGTDFVLQIASHDELGFSFLGGVVQIARRRLTGGWVTDWTCS